MTRLAVLPCLALLTAPALAQDVPGPIHLTPEQLGQIFCISMLGNDMAAVFALATGDLLSAIDEAEFKNSEIEAAHPGEKPPLGDGIPWQAAPDYAATCTVGQVTMMMDEASVEIRHGFPEYPSADFTDRLKLKLDEGEENGERRWRIDNVAYADQGDLITALKSAFMN
jgi:hypothetical protein